jgi:hypothetical protein
MSLLASLLPKIATIFEIAVIPVLDSFLLLYQIYEIINLERIKVYFGS